MTATELLAHRELVVGGLVVSVLVLFLIARKVRKLAKSERPDEPLSNLAMVIGLTWSAEAVWELTGPERMDLPLGLRLALFFVFEAQLTLAMIRAKRYLREHGWPGRHGTTAWIVATVMATVAAAASHSLPEAGLRAAIPLLLVKAWWDGLVGGAAKRPENATSWRWTPRRLMLALGAIEPGERDVESVHRERLTQTMTRLEHQRRHGSKRLAGRRSARLARLSLTADDEVIAEVRRRVDRATWFEPTQDQPATGATPPTLPVRQAIEARARRVRHGKAIRKVHVAHPRPVVVAAQPVRQEERETHEIDTVVRAIKEHDPKLPQRQIARLAGTSEPTVRRALRRTQNPAPPPTANGRHPQLEGVTQ
jgi:hypothetical protein